MKKLIRILLIALLSFAIGFIAYKIIITKKNFTTAKERIKTLPKASFYTLDNKLVSINNYNESLPLTIIFFHPDCEHCRYEVAAISQNKEKFQNTHMLMIIPEKSPQLIEDFCLENNLFEIDNLEILLDTEFKFAEIFGVSAIPTIFIYTSERTLKKAFYGEINPELIIEEINEISSVQ